MTAKICPRCGKALTADNQKTEVKLRTGRRITVHRQCPLAGTSITAVIVDELTMPTNQAGIKPNQAGLSKPAPSVKTQPVPPKPSVNTRPVITRATATQPIRSTTQPKPFRLFLDEVQADKARRVAGNGAHTVTLTPTIITDVSLPEREPEQFQSMTEIVLV